MKFCGNCGIQLEDGDQICSNCGAAQNNFEVQPQSKKAVEKVKDDVELPKEEKGGFWWGVLGFIIPLVGIILFFVWRKSKPKKAKSLLIGAIVSIILALVFMPVSIVAIIVCFGMM